MTGEGLLRQIGTRFGPSAFDRDSGQLGRRKQGRRGSGCRRGGGDDGLGSLDDGGCECGELRGCGGCQRQVVAAKLDGCRSDLWDTRGREVTVAGEIAQRIVPTTCMADLAGKAEAERPGQHHQRYCCEGSDATTHITNWIRK
jgi:hypothetical protein